MAVEFYIKWEVYPIPQFLLNDHNFRVYLEQAFTRQQRVMIIPVSPLTTLKDVIHDFRSVAKQIRRPRKVPNLRVMRVALLYSYLIVHSAFHAFKPSDFAAVHGSKPRKRGNPHLLTEKELKDADRSLKALMRQGIPYRRANRQAMRRTMKRRWLEAELTPKIRMATRRALHDLKALLSNPNK
jgi:hypothetical protein